MPFEIKYHLDQSFLNEFYEKIIRYYENIGYDSGSHLAESVQVAGDNMIQIWLNTANASFSHSSGGYAMGVVNGIQYPYKGDPLQYVGEHKSPLAKVLEEGRGPFDMKSALHTSDKVRISKDGNRYLIIPFRHGIPGSKRLKAMPKSVFNNASYGRFVNKKFVELGTGAKNMGHSHITGTYTEGSIKGAKNVTDAAMMRLHNPNKVKRNIYLWGDRIRTQDEPLLRSTEKVFKLNVGNGKTKTVVSSPHKTNPYDGMVRMQSNVNINREKFNFGKFTYGSINNTDNMENSSVYMTFRVMSEKSTGWIHPGIKAMHILKKSIERGRSQTLQLLGEGAKKDIQKLLYN